MYYTDSTFRIGCTHDVCEDYACHNQTTIAISDGCSGSPNTNIGALVSAMDFLANPKIPSSLLDLKIMSERIRSKTQMVACNQSRANDSTLLGAKIHIDKTDFDTPYILVTVIGDGCIIYGSDGEITVNTIEFDRNAPAYMSYLTNGELLQHYLKNSDMAKGTRTVRTYNHKFEVTGESVHNFKASTNFSIPFEYYEIEEPDFLILASDGITSLRRKEGRKKVMVPEVEVLKELMDVKLGPNFMRRRVTAMLENTGWEHTDDLSIAAFWKKGTSQ